MKKAAYSIALLLLPSLGLSQSAPELTIDAIALHSDGRTDEAIARLEQAIAQDSTFIDAYVTLGQVYLEAEKPRLAQEILQRAMDFTMSNASLYFALGVAHFRQQQFDQAARHLARTLELEADHPRAAEVLSLAHLNLGVQAYDRGRKGEAAHQFEKALAADSTNVRAYRNLAVVWADMGKRDRARQALSQGLVYDPGNMALLGMSIQLRQRDKDFAGALAAAETLHRHHPEDVEAALQFAYLLRFNSQGDRAIPIYENLITRHPEDHRAYDQFADFHVARGRYDEAAALYQNLLARTSRKSEVYQRLASVHLEAEQFGEARAALRKALGGGEDDAAIYSQIAEAFKKEGDAAGAVAAYREGLEHLPDNWQINRALGRALEGHRPAEAFPVYRKMMALRPNEAYPHVRMGVVYDSLRAQDRAAAEFQRAVNMHTADPLPFLRLVDWKAAGGDTTAAVDLSHQALRKCLKRLAALEAQFVSRLRSSGGSLGAAQMEKMGESGREARGVRVLLRESLDRLTLLERPEILMSSLDDLLEDYAEVPELLEYLGRSYENHRRLPEALSTYERLVKLSPKNPAGHLGMARILEAQEDLARAALASKRALTVRPDDPAIYDTLIRLHEQMDRLPQLADDWLLKARTDPDNTVLLKKLITTLGKVSRTEDLAPVEAMLREAEATEEARVP